MQTILVVEDEPKLAQLHKEYIEQSGFQSHIIHNGLDVIPWIKQNTPNLVVLDLMLPGKDGLTLCKEIRQFSEVPIIMVTARVEEIDRIVGLELGADDYVCKPVSPNELVARIRANVRRSSLTHSSKHLPQGFQTNDIDDGINIHESNYTATLNEQTLDLTAIEFQLLLMLVKRPGRIFSREQIMQHIYSDSRIVSHRTIDSHVKKIRKKLFKVDPKNEYIHALYGVGFKYEKEEKSMNKSTYIK